MELILKRIEEINETTIGQLSIDGDHICWTLEDRVREPVDSNKFSTVASSEWVGLWKIPGKTAIPRGRYSLVISFSKRFGLLLPEILCVPGFTGIRIHPGNKKEDTEGCILVGLGRIKDTIVQSRLAQSVLMSLLTKEYKGVTQIKEPTWITVE